MPARRRKTSIDQTTSNKAAEPRWKRDRNEQLAQSEVLGHGVDLITQLNQTEFSRNIKEEEGQDASEGDTLQGQAETGQEETKKGRKELEVRNLGKSQNLTGPAGVAYEALLDKMQNSRNAAQQDASTVPQS